MNTEQTIRRLIDQDIYVNASQMVQYLMNEGSHWNEELIPACIGDDYSEPPAGYEVSSYTTEGLPGVATDKVFWQWESTDGSGEDLFSTEDEAIRAAWEDAGDEPDPIEALQHWLVSDYLADALEEVGALVARDVLGFNVWGLSLIHI